MAGVWRFAAVAIVAALLLGPTALSGQTTDGAPAGDEFILAVGSLDMMRSLNPLPGIAQDLWTTSVLDTVYDRVFRPGPGGELRPYILKGFDADDDGRFNASEYGVFAKSDVRFDGSPCTPESGCALNITVFYDFNGVYFHDGVQADVLDLLFSYHLLALDPYLNGPLRVLMDDDFSGTRRLAVDLIDSLGGDWDLPLPVGAGTDLRASLRFSVATPYARFAESTLSIPLFPRHVWEGTGELGAPVNSTDFHGDFGCLVDGLGRGIDANETTLPPGCSHPFDYDAAESWSPTDLQTIGTGPFRLEVWTPGQFTRVSRYDDYFVGVNPRNPSQDFDWGVRGYLKMPVIEGVLFKIYRSTTLGVLALKQNEIDFYHGIIPAEFVPDLLNEPNIRVEVHPEPGFMYMGYNMRVEPWGYDAGAADSGYAYRQAVSHLVYKKYIVQNLLQGFGVVGHGVVSPANTFWANPNLPEPQYDPVLADAILDAEYGAWAPVPGLPCNNDNLAVNPAACRPLRGKLTQQFEILTPQADYDPVRAAAGQMIADAMRSVGINVISKPLAFGQIVARLDARDFDQFISGTEASVDPDFLFDLFHSSNAAEGPNHPGYRNATFDTVIETSRSEMNRTRRQELIYEAQEILVLDRPVEPLYYRTNLWGYRSDRVFHWVVQEGDIWNYWSLLSLRSAYPLSPETLSLTLSMPSAVSPGSAAEIVVGVHSDTVDVADATVTLTATDPAWGSAGGFASGSGVTSRISRQPDGRGEVHAIYISPPLEPTETPWQVLITATAEHPLVDGHVQKWALVVVFPCSCRFLAVSVGLPFGDIITPGGQYVVIVEVTDGDGIPVHNSTVTHRIESSSVVVDAVSTSEEGVALTFHALDVQETTRAVFVIDASKAGYLNGTAEFMVTIVAEHPLPPPMIDCLDCDSGDAALVLGVIALTLGIVFFAQVWRRRTRRAL